MSSINHENGSWTNKNSICAMLGNFAVWNGIWQTCGQITAWTSCHGFPAISYYIYEINIIKSHHHLSESIRNQQLASLVLASFVEYMLGVNFIFPRILYGVKNKEHKSAAWDYCCTHI